MGTLCCQAILELRVQLPQISLWRRSWPIAQRVRSEGAFRGRTGGGITHLGMIGDTGQRCWKHQRVMSTHPADWGSASLFARTERYFVENCSLATVATIRVPSTGGLNHERRWGVHQRTPRVFTKPRRERLRRVSRCQKTNAGRTAGWGRPVAKTAFLDDVTVGNGLMRLSRMNPTKEVASERLKVKSPGGSYRERDWFCRDHQICQGRPVRFPSFHPKAHLDKAWFALGRLTSTDHAKMVNECAIERRGGGHA